jgi:phosphoribosylamine--glycine ligase
VVGIADGLAQAERIAEEAVIAIRGAVDHRADIGTEPLIRKRIDHMQKLRKKPIPSGG